jgi:hypothetical protein
MMTNLEALFADSSRSMRTKLRHVKPPKRRRMPELWELKGYRNFKVNEHVNPLTDIQTELDQARQEQRTAEEQQRITAYARSI